MRHTKRILSVLLVLMLVAALSVPTMAAAAGIGTITISNAVEGETYSIYRIFSVEYNADRTAYVYKAADHYWKEFLTTYAAQTYVTVDSNDVVTWIPEKDTAADHAAFAKAALIYAQSTTGVVATDSEKATFDTVTFTGLELGYYLVDSSLGTLCALTTTDENAAITEKNVVPDISKTVKEGESWETINSAQIGDTVEFQTTIFAKSGAKSYMVHDKMSEGLTFVQDSVTITQYVPTTSSGSDYTYGPGETVPEESYTLTTSTTDDCTFEIVFESQFLDTVITGTKIVIEYSAVLNEKAEIVDSINSSNTNKTQLSYGDNSSTEWEETRTYTYKFDVVKTDGSNKLLSGAKFELYNHETGGNKIDLIAVDTDDDGTTDYYRVATEVETKAPDFTSAVIEAGKATVVGLDAAVYWLQETAAPSGYNLLDNRVEVDMSGGHNVETSMSGDLWEEGDGGVRIINESGSLLPGTGGMGTTLFYVLGGVLAACAAVLLITKRRMKSGE